MGKQKDAKENNLVKTSIRENPAGREQSGPKKQSKLLDYMQEIMLEKSLADVMDLVGLSRNTY